MGPIYEETIQIFPKKMPPIPSPTRILFRTECRQQKKFRLCVTTLCEVISHNGALVRHPSVIENQHTSWIRYTSWYDGDFPWRHVSWSRRVNVVSIHLPVSQKLSLTCFFQFLNLLSSDLAGRSVYRYTCHLPKIAPCLSFQARQRNMQDKPSFSLILTPAGFRGKPSAWRI